MEVYQEYKEKGYTNTWIYRNHLKDQFRISIKTMYSYLNVPYKRELLKIEEKLKEKERNKWLDELDDKYNSK